MRTLLKVLLIPAAALLVFGAYKQGTNKVVAPVVMGADYTSAIESIVKDLQTIHREMDQQQRLGAFNPTGGGTYRLQSSIGASNTTINLSSFKEPISGIPYTMSYLNETTGYGTLDPQNTLRSEFVSFTGITQNSDGSATLTGVTRGISRTPGTGGCVASSTLASSHSGQSIFILSNSPCFYSEFAVKQNDETVTGSWSFPTTPSGSNNPATKAYVLSVLTGTTTISTDKVIVTGTAGETVTAGQLVYLNTSDARWYKVNASSANTTDDVIIGIAQSAGSSGVSIGGGVLLQGLDTNQTGLVAGINYFASTTAGALGLATTTRPVGKAKSTTSIYLSPSFLSASTVGTNVFSGTNKFTSPTTVTDGTYGLLNMQLLASTSISSAASSIAVTSIPSRTFLRVYFQTPFLSTTANANITFNNDTGSDYAWTTSSTTCTGSGIKQVSQSNIQIGNSSGQFMSASGDIVQIGTTTTAMSINQLNGGTIASGVGSCTTQGIWVATSTASAKVNQIKVTASSGTFAASTTLYVFGSSF